MRSIHSVSTGRFDIVRGDESMIPFIMAGVGGHQDLMQRDGLHPNAAGARKVEELVMKTLSPLVGAR